MSEKLKLDRHRFLSAAAITLTAGPLAMISSADAQPVQANSAPIRLSTTLSFDTIKQINAGVLNMGYAEDGPANGPVVTL